MPDEGFALPGSSYEELVKVVRAYDHFPTEIALNEVSSVAGMHPTNVSRNNQFLVATGVISGGKKKGITEAGRALARSLEHNIEDEIARNWQSIISANDFLNRIVAAVRIRKGMEESALQAHIAYTAGQPKNPAVMAGAGAVIQILKVARILREEDGKYVVESSAPGAASVDTSVSVSGVPIASGAGLISVEPRYVSVAPSGTSATPGATPITIQIQIQCSANEVDELAPKIRKLLRELGQTDPHVAEGE